MPLAVPCRDYSLAVDEQDLIAEERSFEMLCGFTWWQYGEVQHFRLSWGSAGFNDMQSHGPVHVLVRKR
jgi:hypothetical protein